MVPLFAVCQGLGTRQTAACLPCATPLRHTANALFNGVPSTALYFAVGPEKHSAKCLPCARNVAHGKQALCRPLYAVSCLPCVTLGKHFAECKPTFAVHAQSRSVSTEKKTRENLIRYGDAPENAQSVLCQIKFAETRHCFLNNDKTKLLLFLSFECVHDF